jgi:hypothetical protein
MAGETGLTAATTTLPKLLRADALKARYAKSQIWKRCLNGVEGDKNVSGQIKNYGDTVTFHIFPNATVGDINTDTGALTQQTFTPTAKNIVINKWKGIKSYLVDIANIQSVLNWESEFSKNFGEAISEQQDIDVLALVNGLGDIPAIGGAGSMTDGIVLQAQRTLDDNKVPEDGRTWGMAPSAESDLLMFDKFTIASATGYNKGLQVEGGRLKALYGTPVVVTPLITTSAGVRQNVLFHKEAFGVVMQRDFTFEKFARTEFATPYGASALYGVAEVRDNHAIQVQTAAV